MQRESIAPPRKNSFSITSVVCRLWHNFLQIVWAAWYEAWLRLSAHPAYQRTSKTLSKKWKVTTDSLWILSQAMCQWRICAPCRAVAGACTSREPRTVKESWLRRILHWGPLVAIFIIATVTLSATYSALQLWSLPPSVVTYMRGTHFCLMYIWLVPIFWNFFKAMRGPGYVPLGWKPKKAEEEQYLQYCNDCQGFKPPRTHHCKACKRCIKKMDHHCPWINSCVGHSNHTNFLLFLFFVPFGCIHGVVVNANFLYHLLSYHFTFHRVYLGLNMGWILFAVTGISFGAGTAIGVLILFLTQVKTIVTNRTQIEDWILEKARHRRMKDRSLSKFVYPYNLGWRENLSLVVNWRFTPVGDGIDWPIKEGSDKYAFTVEQLEQKKAKKQRAITCNIKKPYDGRGCPCSDYGVMTALCAPRCQEDLIPVDVGDIVVVTRWERKWVYGSVHRASVGVKGWFPRQSISLPERRQRIKEKTPPPSPSVMDTRMSSGQSPPSSQSESEGEANVVSKVHSSEGETRCTKPAEYKHVDSTSALKSTSDKDLLANATSNDTAEHKPAATSPSNEGQLKKRSKKKNKRTT